MNQACSVAQLQAVLASATPPLVIDVRRAATFQQADELISQADWKDPERLSDWSGALDKARPIVVYCVHGHQVSQGCAASLRELGYQVSFLEGGIEEWKAAKGPITIKDRRAETTPRQAS
jgi:thiosulfate sulfurtransferase